MKTNLGRTECAIMQNKSGGALALGDVVIVDTANAAAVDVTTTSAYSDGRVGVVIEPNGITADGYGMIAFGGYVPQINLSGSASIGDLVKTHTVAGQGVRHAAPLVSGDFAQVLGTGTSPEALLFGAPVYIPAAATVVNDYVLIVDEKTAGTDGGTFTSGAWQTRTLNTEKADAGGIATLSSNQITLAAGTYRFHVSAPAFSVNNHQVKLYNVTDAADVEIGTSAYCGSGDFTGNRSEAFGEFTIASSKAFEVRHRCGTTKSTNGFGEKANVGSVEKYAIAEFWRVAS